ncbi:hypothetical protein DH2020_016388 [Rehmannia glutinosa]|uniref:Helicase ATP-binding domain-containing protein n=1 Tax=Rehmannia glutinosa TaxID=99300 RepID=A0ABR0WPM8_REHGL
MSLMLLRIRLLHAKCNALLESPTGTGKTLCLLCAALAWRRSLGEFSRGRKEISNIRGSQLSDEELPQSQSSTFPTIIYTSRTHSQIRKPKMVVLGSREQLCIHDQVSLLRGKAQTNACHALCKKRTKRYCAHFHVLQKNPGIGDDPIDIKDLVNIGKSSGPCPYYLSRELHKDVDILFAPYNYLIDRGNRKSLKINWNNSILIFDEAHNLEGLCADAASFDLPSGLLTACISEAKKCVDLSITRRDTSSDKSCNPDDFAILKALLLKLEKRIAEVHIESKELGFTKVGPYIYELLSELNITQKTADMLIEIIEKACALLEEDANASESGGSHKTSGTIFRLESMGDILRLIFRDNSNAHAQYYRVHIQEVEASATDAFRGKTSRTLSWWCFNPGIALEEFSRLGVGSIILTSGTLSPLDSFAEELKLEFPIRLENPHVISGNQIWAGVAPVGPSGYSFNSSYRSRGSIEYKLELGNAIDGLLVFFPSYYLLEQCISCWKTTGQQNLTNSTTVWERICKHKLPVVEPRQSSLFTLAIECVVARYGHSGINDKFLLVHSLFEVKMFICMHMVSEGLDFADHAGRAVVITGLPFATMTDPKVRLKREYLDQQAQSQKIGNKGLTGEEWYTQQASRAVNQAVGRVIRHKHDYGAIILCDESLHIDSVFRDAGTLAPPKLELTQNENQVEGYEKASDVDGVGMMEGADGTGKWSSDTQSEKIEIKTIQDWFCVIRIQWLYISYAESVRVLHSSQPMDKFHLEKLLAPQMTAVDRSFSLDSSSSNKQVKQGDISSRLKEIVPANRSYLTSDKIFHDSSFKCSNDPTRTRKEPLISGKKSILDLDEETGDVAASCILGKHRLLITGPDQPKHYEKSDHDFSNLKTFARNILEHKDVVPQTVPRNNEETKGSAFLIQVREKLTDAEYKEFVGFMKALKSKSMKICNVLQSIARLFSFPDRRSLLHGYQIFIQFLAVIIIIVLALSSVVL